MKKKILLIALLIAEAITVTMPVIILGRYFNFPDILRQPAQNAFKLFNANQIAITLGYYIFLLSSLLYIPLSYAFKGWYQKTTNTTLLNALVGMGITTAIFQSIGFIRWIFTMHYLTETYFNQPENRQAATLIYETLNLFAGMSIGEHLGFMAMGSWTIILGVLLVVNLQVKKWLGYIGVTIGLVLITSVGEHFGGKPAPIFGTINFVANTLWTFWIIAIAFILFKSRQRELIPLTSGLLQGWRNE